MFEITSALRDVVGQRVEMLAIVTLVNIYELRRARKRLVPSWAI